MLYPMKHENRVLKVCYEFLTPNSCLYIAFNKPVAIYQVQYFRVIEFTIRTQYYTYSLLYTYSITLASLAERLGNYNACNFPGDEYALPQDEYSPVFPGIRVDTNQGLCHLSHASRASGKYGIFPRKPRETIGYCPEDRNYKWIFILIGKIFLIEKVEVLW